MKRFLVFVSAAAMLVAVSCAKEEVQNIVEKPVVNEEPTVEKVKWVISASAPQTKTTVGNDGTYKWVNKDAIKVFDAEGTSLGKFTAINLDEPAKKADFDGTIPEGKIPTYAVYPYNESASCTSEGVISTVIPTEQDGTIASAISCATSTDGKNFTFNNAVSVIKLNFNAEDNICGVSVEFEDPVAGPVEFDCNDGDVKFAASKVVSVEKNGPLSGDVYLCVAPTEKKNIKLTFLTLDDKVATLKTSVKNEFSAGVIKSLGTVSGLKFSYTLKAFAKEFVKALDCWEKTVGVVEADNKHSGSSSYKSVHLIPIENTAPGYTTPGNQYDDALYPVKFTVTVDGQTYTSSQAWEIAQRGLLDLVTKEGSAELVNFNDSRNHAMTLSDGASLLEPMPSYTPACKWGPHPWYEYDKLVTYNGGEIENVGVDFMVKVGAWHVVRGLVKTDCNTSPLGYIGNYQEFDTSDGTLNLDGYVGYISPMREFLVLARFYKYLLDNNITENVYTAVKNQKFDFDLYGPTLKDFAKSFATVNEIWKNSGEVGSRKLNDNVTIEVGGITYDKKKMFETAARGLNYLNASNHRLYDGLSAVTLSNTKWSTDPYLENQTPFSVTGGGSDVSIKLIENATSRQINYANGSNNVWANQVGYTSNQVAGYGGYFCLERHLLVMARLYGYLVDNKIDNVKSNLIDNFPDQKIIDSTLK